MTQRYLQILAEAGIKPTILPCQPKTKVPAVKWAKGKPETTFEDGTVVADFYDTKTRVILTGVRSNGVVVIDVDTKLDGFPHFEGLERQLGTLPPTMTVRSPTGGLHLYFKHPAAFRTVKNVNKITGVDIRAEGGVAVTPGSEHPSAPGLYVIEDEHPIAMLPPTWADWLPRARDPGAPMDVVYVAAEPSELRERLGTTAKGRQGDGWAALRRCAKGERMFRIEGGPGADDLPIVHGVDDFVSKAVWSLAHAEGWSNVEPEAFVRLVEPSFSIMRADAAAIQATGSVTKLTPEELARKWSSATAKAQADQAAAAAFVAKMEQQVAAAKAPGALAPILQWNRQYLVLDDREEGKPRYSEPMASEAIPGMARYLWQDRRSVECPDKQGIRDMTPAELVSAYGRPIERFVLDYTRTAPSIEDLTLIRGPERLPLPEPVFDPQVAEWLTCLDQSGDLLDWIAWAAPERALVTVPALTMVGDAHVGKTLLADALARAAGLRKAEPLGRALGRFNRAIADSPILLGDEGIPRKDNGQPQTEEFRQLITAVDHSVEQKGSDRRLIVRGAPRVILATNRLDRLFSGRGQVNAADVAAITRRLFVCEILGQLATRAHDLAVGLGTREGDPVRLLRVAAHCRHLQITRPCDREVAPRSGAVARELRRGGDLMAGALAVLEDVAGVASWVKLDAAHGLVWIQFDAWARACGAQNAQALDRAADPYIVNPSAKRTLDPITGQPLENPQRWAGLDLGRLALDGINLT